MPSSVAYQFYVSMWGGLDYLYPPLCGGCGVQGSRWCQNCASSLEWIQNPLCPTCGQEQDHELPCFNCQSSPPSWDQLRSLVRYRGAMRHAIISLKYKRNLGLGEVFSKHLIQRLSNLAWKVDLIVPVPSDLARMHERGYNQVSLLAYPIALALRVPFRSNALRKVRQTPRQVSLRADQRRINLASAFEADQGFVDGKAILLIDDVVTTGATMEACSRALKKAGAKMIFALSLARAGYQIDHEGNEISEDAWANQIKGISNINPHRLEA